MLYANAYAPRDGVLRLHLIANGEDVKKADAYLIALDGRFFLIDGGMTGDIASYRYLLRLREAILRGAPDEAAHAPLRLTWIVSHFHQDHSEATRMFTLRDRRFAFDAVYLPPATLLDAKYPGNGDAKYRARTIETVALHHPEAEVVTSVFGGDPLTIPLGDAGGSSIVIYPPDRDWGCGEDFADLVDLYYGGDYGEPRIATPVVNACSQWVSVSHGGRAALFTGDTMKRTPDHVEALDTMLARYGAMLPKIDILKWLHHGYVRDNAAPALMALEPAYLFFNHPAATAPDVISRPRPVLINHGRRDTVIEVAADGGIKVLCVFGA